jgi:hypothetical protein
LGAPGRNDPCPCGSGRKYKQCCLQKDETAAREARAKVAETAAPAPEGETETASAAAAAKTQQPGGGSRHATQQPWKAQGGKATRSLPRFNTPRKAG